jgi:putative acetyltransferase
MNPRSASDVSIRIEEPEDAAAIRRVNELAFEGRTEADIVDALRAAGAVVLSMVAVGDHGQVLGHVLVSPVTVVTRHDEFALLGLGPVSVLPSEQHHGIGTRLIDACLEQLRLRDHAGVVVVGEPHFYHRFGFIPASRWGLRWDADAPNDIFMALELCAGRLTGINGVVHYRREFSAA